ncbi:MAG TPA: hypothetical protein VGW38_18645, partial [Chloroflexota bacterium]|nr:hypothetical protein [Chloroflexota bacterium]
MGASECLPCRAFWLATHYVAVDATVTVAALAVGSAIPGLPIPGWAPGWAVTSCAICPVFAGIAKLAILT